MMFVNQLNLLVSSTPADELLSYGSALGRILYVMFDGSRSGSANALTKTMPAKNIGPRRESVAFLSSSASFANAEVTTRDQWSRREIYESAKPQLFPHYDSAKKLLRKRNSDRYREPQQRFTKPQTGLYTIRARTVVTDFEKVARHAISTIFPNSQRRGCRFHLGQSWWRRIQTLGDSSTSSVTERE